MLGVVLVSSLLGLAVYRLAANDAPLNYGFY